MTLEKIDHVGIAVEDLDQSVKIYSDLFGKAPDELCTLESEKVKLPFLMSVRVLLSFWNLLVQILLLLHSYQKRSWYSSYLLQSN